MNEKPDITGSVTFGLVFILLGALALLNEMDVLSLSWAYILPVLLIIAGVAIIVSTQFSSSRQE